MKMWVCIRRGGESEILGAENCKSGNDDRATCDMLFQHILTHFNVQNWQHFAHARLPTTMPPWSHHHAQCSTPTNLAITGRRHHCQVFLIIVLFQSPYHAVPTNSIAFPSHPPPFLPVITINTLSIPLPIYHHRNQYNHIITTHTRTIPHSTQAGVLTPLLWRI